MTKIRTMPERSETHNRAEEFHEKLEKEAETARLHSRKVEQDARDAESQDSSRPGGSAPNLGHERIQTAHLEPENSAAQRKRPPGAPNTGEDPGAQLKR